jgi:hypothetical protein
MRVTQGLSLLHAVPDHHTSTVQAQHVTHLLLIQQPLGAVQRILAGKGPCVSDHSTKEVTTGGILL